jgi:hypothetical protein
LFSVDYTPGELQRNFNLMRDLDQRAQGNILMRDLDQRAQGNILMRDLDQRAQEL